MVRIVTALSLIACCLAADAAPDAKPEAKLPAAAQAVLDRYAKAEAKLESDHRKALAAERQRAIADLEKAQKTATKAGDLDAALAVKGQIEELQKADAADADALLGDKPAAPKADLAKQVLGYWMITKPSGSAPCQIHEGGNVMTRVGQLMLPGRWRIEKGRVVITWMGDESKAESLAFDGPDRMTGDSFDAGKGGVTLTRLRQPPGDAPAQPPPPGQPPRH